MAQDTLVIYGDTFTNVAGIKATDNNSGTKTYIRPTGTKSIYQNGTGIDVTNYASVDIAVPAPTPTLETVTKTYTPGTSAVTDTITPSSGYDGIEEVDVTVSAMPSAVLSQLSISGNTPTITIENGVVTASVATKTGEVAVTASVDGYVGKNAKTPYFIWGTSATEQLQVGTEGTPIATKGSVSNHSISVTPSVTNTEGYISGGTHNGTAVTVSASELVSGTYTVDSAGTKDVTNYASASVPSGSIAGASFSFEKTSDRLNVNYSEAVTGGYISTQTKTGQYQMVLEDETVTPSTSTQTVTPYNNSYYLNSVTVNPIPSEYIIPTGNVNISQAGQTNVAQYATATVPSGTEGTPTASKGTVSNHSVSVTPSVTNSAGYISGGTKTGTAVTVSASELVSGTYTVDSSGTKDVTNYASATVPNASRTLGYQLGYVTESNKFYWRFRPTETVNSPGWISDGISDAAYLYYNAIPTAESTFTPTEYTQYIGTTNTMLESGLTIRPIPSQYIVPTGNLPITQNGNNIDVAQYATVSVNVSGGGGSSVQIAVSECVDIPSATASISFTGMLGEPTSFMVYYNASELTAPSSTPYKIAMLMYDGTTIHGQTITNTNNAQVTYDGSSFSKSYSNGTLTLTSTGAYFQPGDYTIIYSYGGSASNVHSLDVQVGSGATSITFTGLEDEPIKWYCIFKSNFSSSSGYQRVIGVTDIDGLIGFAMDSSAHQRASWTSSYNNGSFTITSTSTNNGGYFHQPGYYQLTYVIGEASPYEKVSKTYRASTTAQSEKIEPSTGYDAMSEVNISIPAVTQTNLTAANIKSGTTVTISNGSTNLWSITGTYSGGGGGANIATATMTNSSNQNASINFTLPSGRTPKAFFARLTSQIARNSNSRYYYVFDMRWDGSSTGGVAGNTFYMYNGTLTNVTSGYSYSQSGTTFTLSSTGSRSASPGSFYNGTYELVYVY